MGTSPFCVVSPCLTSNLKTQNKVPDPLFWQQRFPSFCHNQVTPGFSPKPSHGRLFNKSVYNNNSMTHGMCVSLHLSSQRQEDI